MAVKKPPGEKENAEIRVRLTPAKKAQYLRCAALDKVPQGSAWAKMLMERRAREQVEEMASGRQRTSWACHKCGRINAPFVATCPCSERDRPKK